jgi:hypothetical protein
MAELSENMHQREASKEKLAVFGGELLKKKSSTRSFCLAPIVENNKNKQFTKENEIGLVPSRLYHSTPSRSNLLDEIGSLANPTINTPQSGPQVCIFLFENAIMTIGNHVK